MVLHSTTREASSRIGGDASKAANLIEKMGEVLRGVQDAGCGYVNVDKQCPSCGADAALKDVKDDWHAPDCKLAECLREIKRG